MVKNNYYKKTTRSGLDVKVRKTKDYPFAHDTRKPFHVLIDDGNNYFVEGFDTKKKAEIYAKKVR